MPPLLDCPEINCWQVLFDDTAPSEQRKRFERHLEACPACQERLDRVEAGEDTLRRLGRRVGDPSLAPIDPTLVQVMERLREVNSPLRIAPGEPEDLYFLRPAEQPNILGTLGAYEVAEVIGQGGMGIVLKAFEPALHRLVAIKVLSAAIAGSSTARRRFTREAQTAAAVCHEHIVAVYGVHEADGLPYLVMQYVAGESLQTRLDRTGPLELVEIVRIGLQTASGLAAAHAQGLIHRDIKPANLLLEKGLARVKITDFGLARMTDDVQLTQNGVVAGTPEYMAPEQARGETVDHRADLYCLGSVLYACCTGDAPFRGSTTLALLRQASERKPTPLRSLNPNVPVWLESFISRLMAKNPDERFQSAAEVALLLEGYLAHLKQPTTVSVPKLPLPLAEDCPRLKEPGWCNGMIQRLSPRIGLAALGLLVVLGLCLVLLAQGALPPAPQPSVETYQDFRGGRPLLPSLILIGRDADTVAKPDDKGLRITLSPDRNNHDPVGVATSFSLVGDFVITATYELLSASRPSEGYGVGVSLSVATDPQRTKFAKVARFQRAKEGSVFATEFWINNPPPNKTWQFHSEPTEAQGGQLHLVREGSIIRFLVADGPDNKFHQIDERNFGTDDLAHVHLEVVDSGSDGNRVDARLIDLKIRAGKLLPEEGSVPGPLTEKERQAGSRGWWVLAKLLGLLFGCTLVLALGGWLYWRQSRCQETTTGLAAVPDPSAGMEALPTLISFSCAACGKLLKAKAELTGKNVKCSQCGTPGLVPPPTAEAKDTGVKTEAAAPPISFSCAACGKNIRSKAELAGKKVKCSQCGKAVLVPMTKANKAGRNSS